MFYCVVYVKYMEYEEIYLCYISKWNMDKCYNVGMF